MVAAIIEFSQRRPAMNAPYARLPISVLKNQKLSPWARLVYPLLVNYHTEENGCFPGRERLADDLGISVPTVDRALSELCTAKLIVKQRQGRGHTNRYLLVLESSPVMTHKEDDSSSTTTQTDDSSRVSTPESSRMMSPESSPVMTNLDVVKQDQVEKNVNPPSPLRDSTEKRKRPSRLSEDVALTDDWRSAAETIGIVHDVQWQFDQFKDHNLAKGETALDWRRKWQTWCRNAIAWNKRGPAGVVPAAAPVPVDTPEDRLTRTRALLAKLESGEWVHDPVLRERYPDDDNGRRNLQSAKVNLARLIAEAEGQEH